MLLMSLLEDLAGSPEFEEPRIFYVQLRSKPSSRIFCENVSLKCESCREVDLEAKRTQYLFTQMNGCVLNVSLMLHCMVTSFCLSRTDAALPLSSCIFDHGFDIFS
ncbi:hypothetical protein F2P81_011582 [Scophthalmus maximus]|uniref:Uncharacterized protein n=1 Tax=Scophthalmus maximus TaxID=52904 RepID=A0A6A4SWM4_SCOMX|nr:hypothetical protein F2P81_011582 [Scophthalmus maximus]